MILFQYTSIKLCIADKTHPIKNIWLKQIQKIQIVLINFMIINKVLFSDINTQKLEIAEKALHFLQQKKANK